ncbi:MAG: hypothetical protein N4J56_002214 [Chroococcidiopsis sp. SAG 2025]|nr:hypothetical protein [Chroococcidiopsis sp. SAG 2025]
MKLFAVCLSSVCRLLYGFFGDFIKMLFQKNVTE